MRASPLTTMRLRTLLILLFCCFASCANYEEKRIRQLLNEKGFGTRATGQASMENYLAGGDAVVFSIDAAVLSSAGAERLALITQAQPIGLDGTILIPYVGPVMVLGLTERQLKRLVESLLEPLFELDIHVEPRILDLGKYFYAFGEVTRKGRIPYRTADFTLLDAITIVGPTPLANMGRVRLIKPDAETPLIIEVNIREMIQSGNTLYNVQVSENDWIYIPPTWIGAVARFIEKLLQPLNVAVQSLLGLATIKYSYDIVRGEQNAFFFRY